jgi:hypothetical protein
MWIASKGSGLWGGVPGYVACERICPCIWSFVMSPSCGLSLCAGSDGVAAAAAYVGVV